MTPFPFGLYGTQHEIKLRHEQIGVVLRDGRLTKGDFEALIETFNARSGAG